MPKAGSASAPNDHKDARASSGRGSLGGTLGRDRRLRKSEEFTQILKQGVRGHGAVLGVAMVPAQGRGRVGISASTKVGGSVGRNRARRLVKEGYRRMFGKSAPYDIVVTVNPKILGSSAEDVRQALDEAIASALVRRNSVRRSAGPRH